LIIPVHAGNPGTMTGAGNWTYLLVGEVPVLVDAGVGKTEHLDAVAAFIPDGPAHVIVTHAHGDHASGAVAVARRWPRTRFWKMPWPERDAKYSVEWNPVVDGQMIAAGDGELEVVHTPGHAPDHICLWHSATRTLFSGDLMVLGSTVVVPASDGGNLADYLASLARIDALNPSRLLPAHGAEIEDPRALIRAYVDHRHERERQVLAAVREGLGTPDAIADRIYVGLPDTLRLMARESVLAHLLKLETDGVIERRRHAWLPRSLSTE
jgi:glyoxylase-like metal-dependent hydrolase (beta-lactamase superfamily II)